MQRLYRGWPLRTTARERAETTEQFSPARAGISAPAPQERRSAEIIPFNPRRQRFLPVAEITRLAADSAGARLELPARELETADGRFRLQVSSEGDQVVIAVQTLGLAADQFAGKLIGLAAAEAAEPLLVLQLDDDGDGEVRLPDSDDLRRALLNPVLGTIEDL